MKETQIKKQQEAKKNSIRITTLDRIPTNVVLRHSHRIDRIISSVTHIAVVLRYSLYVSGIGGEHETRV